jgi:nucleotide-binding universal stress UspA family protein
MPALENCSLRFPALYDLAFCLKPAMPQDNLPQVPPGRTIGSDERPDLEMDEDVLVYHKILVPIDFSDHSRSTVSYAMRFASRYKSTVYLLHVFQVPDYAITSYACQRQNYAEVQLQVDAAEQEARESLESFAKELSNLGINVEPHFRVGYPFDDIVLMANHFDVDLIVIGSHGRGGISRLLVGSTAQRVVEHARCPVLVVKGPRTGKPRVE